MKFTSPTALDLLLSIIFSPPKVSHKLILFRFSILTASDGRNDSIEWRLCLQLSLLRNSAGINFDLFFLDLKANVREMASEAFAVIMQRPLQWKTAVKKQHKTNVMYESQRSPRAMVSAWALRELMWGRSISLKPSGGEAGKRSRWTEQDARFCCKNFTFFFAWAWIYEINIQTHSFKNPIK